jgi:hypothetical protein
MNIFTYIIGKFSVLTCFKLLFILALFFLNLYLYFSEPNEYAIKECGPNLRVKKILGILSAISSIYGGYAGYKSISYPEINIVQKEAILNKQKLEDAQKILDLSAKYVHSCLPADLQSLDKGLPCLLPLMGKKQGKATSKGGEVQHINEKEFRDSLLNFTSQLKKLADTKSTSFEDQIEIKKKIDYLSSTFCTDSKKFVEDHPEYKDIMEVFNKDQDITVTFACALPFALQRTCGPRTKVDLPWSTAREESGQTFVRGVQVPSKGKAKEKEISSNIDEDTNKSFMFSGLIENYEKLDFMGKIALGLLLLNYVLISSLISIIFIFYGDYLIKNYQIEVKYPKLAKIISLRRKFQKYYLIMDSLIIISVILIEIIFCIAILFF